MNQKKIIIIAHDIRSTLNVGSLFRTADGLGVEKIYLTGYTPYPKSSSDARLPHISAKLNKQINKTALGAEATVNWEHVDNPEDVILYLKQAGYEVIALEQTSDAVQLNNYRAPDKVAILLGREVEGINSDLVKLADKQVEILMQGKKESFNVVIAAAICLFYIRYQS